MIGGILTFIILFHQNLKEGKVQQLLEKYEDMDLKIDEISNKLASIEADITSVENTFNPPEPPLLEGNPV